MSYDNKLITPENRIIVAIISSLLLIIFVMLGTRIIFNDLIERVELKSYDWRSQIAAKKAKNQSDIVILVVDDISLQNAVSHPELGLSRWPWPRSVHGDIVKYLNNAGAKAIIFDIIFEGAEGLSESNNASDQYFENALQNVENVFFAISFTYSNKALENYTNKKQIKQNILKISSDSLKKNIQKFAVKNKEIRFSEKILNNIEFYNVSNILPGLLKQADGLGSVTLPQSADGIIRKTRPLAYFQENYYPSLPLSVYLKLNPDVKYRVEGNKMYLNQRIIPLDNQGARFINWYGPANTFSHFRALDVILAQRAINAGQKNPLDASKFKDKIVIVGLTAAATDILPTPMSGAYPGPEVVASSMYNYFESSKFISKLETIPVLLITFVFVLIIGSIILTVRSGFKGIMFSLTAIILYVYLCIYLFINEYIWLDIIYPSMSMLFAIMITFMSKYVTTRKAFEDTYQLATTDGLTGLFNHRYFQETITVALKRAGRYQHEVSLILLDIDFFKKINDEYGHRAGDKVLKDIAERIQNVVRATDVVARYGGEEIAIILDNTSYENAFIAAHKVLKIINGEEFEIRPGFTIPITASLGVASFPKHGNSPPEIIESADKGLYFAKENGRNRIGTIEEIEPEEEVLDLAPDKKPVELLLQLDKEEFDQLKSKTNLQNEEEVIQWIKKQIDKANIPSD
jgi:diguanylate cyclase (GGDEF)-like protein